MAWLIGIVCIILIIMFWRIFLPIIAAILIAGGIYYLYDEYQSERKKKQEQEQKEILVAKIATAKLNATSLDKHWRVTYEPDPATGTLIARGASIQSDDGLCYLRVERRIEAFELTDLRCPDFTISSYEDIDVKFDTEDTSRRMRLDSYRNGGGVFITSQQYTSSNHLQYSDFITKLTSGNSLAIKIPIEEISWVRFNLNGAFEAISKLGKPEGYMPLKEAPKVNDNDSTVMEYDDNVVVPNSYQYALKEAQKRCKKEFPDKSMGDPEFNLCVDSAIDDIGYENNKY